MPAADRAALRAALVERYPWLRESAVGPQAVEAGECPRCGAEARLVETCGPVAWVALGRGCARELGASAWCDGHAEQADATLAWLERLPPEADDVARLWWVATGEVRPDPALFATARRLRLPAGAADRPPPAGGTGR